jgi:L-alanine-DL-glutamate epimerase-like enolase superfamily enzyme
LEQLLTQADAFQEAGFRAIKMKVGRSNTREDIERVAAMRTHLGENFPLMVDANMRWTADQAISAARALQDFNLVWLEEPTIPDDLPGHARILRDGGIPIAAGENLHTLHEFRAAIDAAAVSYPEPDVTNCGGYTVFRKIASLAEAHNLPVTSHGVHDLTVHALAAAPNRTYMEAHGFSLESYIADPMPIVDGFVTAPDTPGHGIELDFTALESHRA